MSVSNINKMIDYCIKMPENDEYEIGHRYPYYSCELLCSINGLNIERLLSINEEENDKNIKKDKKEEDPKILDNNDNESKEKNEELIKKNDINEDKNKIENINIDKEITDQKDDKQVENKNNNMEKENVDNENDIYNKEIYENSEKKEDLQDNKFNEEVADQKTDETINEQEEKDENKIEEEEKKDENMDNNENLEIKMEIEDLELKQNEIKTNLPNISLVHSVFDHIFSFLDKKSSIENTVLLGYFNKIVNYLIKTKTRITLEYVLLKRTELISKLIENINKISISNIISNILNALTEENTPETNEKYMIVVNECSNFISKIENNSEEDLNSVDLICDLIINHIIYNNKIKFAKIIDADIITKFEEIVVKYSENYGQNLKKLMYIINLLTKMNKSILSNLPKKITTTQNSDDTKIEMLNLINAIDRTSNQYISFTSKKNDFKELVYNSFINKYMSYCNTMNNISLIIINNKLNNSQNIVEKEELLLTPYSEEKIEKYKYSNLIELEYIVSIFDIYVNLYNIFLEDENKRSYIKEKIEQIIKKNFFKFMFDDYFKYKNNNFLINIIIDLIKIVFDNNIAPKELILNILLIEPDYNENKNDNLITLLINELVQNTKFTFTNSNNQTNQILFSSNVTILKYIFSCTNPYISEILNPMEKEKFFYKFFITNIYNIFSKKLFKIDSNDNAIEKINSLGIKFGFGSTLTQSNTNISFSIESLNNIIDFNLQLYEKYKKGEEYEYLFEERDKKIEQIKKSTEYLQLNGQLDDELEAEEDEDEDINEFNLPKPVFFNSKLEHKINENDEKDKITTDSEDNLEIEKEEKTYNDVNYWHVEIKDENMEDLLKDL